MKTVGIVQSNYIPWKGYFDLIATSDEFILYDDVQYTRRDWRNRNLIKTPLGLQWLTVPVKVKNNFHRTVREIEIDGTQWALDHWNALSRNYGRTPYYQEIADWLKPLYCERSWSHLSELNRSLIEAICSYLNIRTKISGSWEYRLQEGKTERLVDLCTQTQATEYVSGPSAKEYLEEKLFEERGIKVRWFSYEGYPEYPQRWGPFKHQVTVLDLLFHCGKKSSLMMKFPGNITSIESPFRPC